MVRRRASRGFTMIELMVTLFIIALLALMAAPLGSAWVRSAQVRLTVHRLAEAMAQAKALALRNPNAAKDDEPAALLLSAGSQLCVLGTIPGGFDCSDPVVWTAKTQAPVTLNGQATQCVALNNQALTVSAMIGQVTCGSSLSYVVDSGSTEAASGTLN